MCDYSRIKNRADVQIMEMVALGKMDEARSMAFILDLTDILERPNVWFRDFFTKPDMPPSRFAFFEFLREHLEGRFEEEMIWGMASLVTEMIQKRDVIGMGEFCEIPFNSGKGLVQQWHISDAARNSDARTLEYLLNSEHARGLAAENLPELLFHSVLDKTSDKLEYLIKEFGPLDSSHKEVILRCMESSLYDNTDASEYLFKNYQHLLNKDDWSQVLGWIKSESGLDLANYAIQQGADVNASEMGTYTTFLNQIEAENMGMVKLMLQNGASPNLGCDNYFMPFRLALSKSHGMASLLLEYGADINAIDSDGATALMRNVKSGSLKNVKFLVAHGADLTIQCDGHTALDIAREDEANGSSVAGKIRALEKAEKKLLLEAGAASATD